MKGETCSHTHLNDVKPARKFSMTVKECKWCKDEFCVNDQCPMCADYCPTAQYPGVCKYEELVDVEIKLAPKGCLYAALTDNGIDVTNINVDKIYDDFVALMLRNNNLKFEGEENTEDTKTVEKESSDILKPGMQICLRDVANSSNWKRESSSFDGYNLTYVTRDGTLSVTFQNGNKFGTICLNR